MALSNVAMIIIVIVPVLVPSILAKEYVVGDEKGWITNFDYQTWAQGKEFRVGDTVAFNYAAGVHNVLRVNQTAFQQCITSPVGVEPLTTGNDVITLSTPGNKWYICGKGDHCASKSMKLAITVLPQLESPAASPSPAATPMSAAATGGPASSSYAWIVAVGGVLGMVMV